MKSKLSIHLITRLRVLEEADYTEYNIAWVGRGFSFYVKPLHENRKQSIPIGAAKTP